jgi:hypothetical protein
MTTGRFERGEFEGLAKVGRRFAAKVAPVARFQVADSR